MKLTVYLAGEIHSDWRNEIKQRAEELNLPLYFNGPIKNHSKSVNIGECIKGAQPNAIFTDEAASSFNNLRTQILMKKLILSLHYSELPINSGILQWMLRELSKQEYLLS